MVDPQKWIVYNGKSSKNGWFKCTPIPGNLQTAIDWIHLRTTTRHAALALFTRRGTVEPLWDQLEMRFVIWEREMRGEHLDLSGG